MAIYIYELFVWTVVMYGSNVSYIRIVMGITVNEHHCGGAIDLDTHGSLNLNYYGADLGKIGYFEPSCDFRIYNSKPNMEICVRNKKPYSIHLDIDCDSVVNYYLGEKLSVLNAYSCSSFVIEPLCTYKHSVHATFIYGRYFVNYKNLRIELEIYQQERVQAVPTSSPWTSWSSSSSGTSSGSDESSSSTWVWAILGTILIFLVIMSTLWNVCGESCSGDATFTQETEQTYPTVELPNNTFRSQQTMSQSIEPGERSASYRPEYNNSPATSYAPCPTTQVDKSSPPPDYEQIEEIPDVPPPPYPGV